MKYFEDMVLYIVFTSNPHYRSLFNPPPAIEDVVMAVETVTDPRSAYPDRIRMVVHQTIVNYFRTVYDVTIEKNETIQVQ